MFNKKDKSKIKVLVAMSGGVDSSVSLHLLVREGYDVTGAYMKQWSDAVDVSGVCTWKTDRRDAVRVCAKLGVDLITLDFEAEYREWVLEYMFREYEAYRTPNPDVMCNKYVKFGFWLQEALSLGYEFLATGHYASLKNGKLFIPKDKDKDQTYFLHQLRGEDLKHILFPLGDYTKSEVRRLAKKYNLPTADRAESMGICFVGEVPMKEFLEKRIEHKRGTISLSDGTKVGYHDGLSFYTIGQRTGLDIATSRDNSFIKNDRPLYVVDKKISTNELIVGYEDDPLLFKSVIKISDIHWISDIPPSFPLVCEVRLRHRQSLQKAVLDRQNSDFVLQFDDRQKAISSGQFAVFYLSGECLGGGVID